MSKYTTGEIAKLCGVSVRTVQYYDSRNILVPSELTEGGRRLYSEDDLKRMRIICFLREAGVSINSISELFAEEHPEKVVSILLDQQEQILLAELEEQQKKLDIIEAIKRELKEVKNFSVESIGDIAYAMKNKSDLRKMRLTMVLTGIPVTALQFAAIILWITNGLWWLFVIWACVAIPWGICISKYYFDHVAYICPECHEVFMPRFKEMLWAYHTPKMRRLTCPKCGHKGLCVEVYAEKEGKNNG
jgi:DNA-binding transcriptional MerR regulator/DNA-directed RNA polymerase subunit RPC12/RpoP